MSNENNELLDMLRNEESWKNWRVKNPHQKIDLSGENLVKRNLKKFDLRGVDLREADLTRADLTDAKLEDASLEKATLYETKLPKQSLSRTNFSRTDLSFSDLSGFILTGAKFNQANLKGARLHNANLTHASFVETLATDTDFSNANLTGACIENWRVSSETILENVVCDYVYLKAVEENDKIKFQERRPSNDKVIFAPGEFAALVRKVVETIDLIFTNGIDWQAFFSSFQELREQYKDYELNIQAIERKREDFIIRLEVISTTKDLIVESIKAVIWSEFEAIYSKKIKSLEESLKKSEKDCLEQRKKNTDLLGAISTLAETQNTMAETQNTMAETQNTMAETQKIPTTQTTIHAPGSNIAAINSGSGNIQSVSQIIDTNLDEIAELIHSLKTTMRTFPKEQKADIKITIEDLEADIADERKREPARLGKRIRTLWLVACAVAVGVSGAADFSNNLLELSEKLNMPIPIELIQQNPHILPGG